MVWRHVTKLYANYIQIPSSGLKSALLVHCNPKTRHYKSNIFAYWIFCFDHYCSPSVFHSFLGAFSKLWTATISFFMSLCASIRPSFRPHETTRLSLWTNFHEFWYLGLNPKSVDKIQILLKYDKISRYLAWRRVHNYGNISLKYS
jgi:hypothetical protein